MWDTHTKKAEFRVFIVSAVIRGEIATVCGQHFLLPCLGVFSKNSFNFLPQPKNTHWLEILNCLEYRLSVWMVDVCEGHPRDPSQGQMGSRNSR